VQELKKITPDLPRLPTAEEIRQKTVEAIERLDTILATATIEEKRDLVQKYVRAVKAFPDTHRVEISLYTALFTGMVAGATAERLALAFVAASLWQEIQQLRVA
jgi:hypothetical protein